MQQLVEGAEAAERKMLPAVADAAASGLLPTPAPVHEHRQGYWVGGAHFAEVVLQTFVRFGRRRWDGNAHQVHHHQSVQPILKRRPQ